MIRRLREIVSRVLTTRAALPVLLAVGLMCTASILAIRLSSPERAMRQELHVALGVGVLLLALLPHYQVAGRVSYILFGAVTLLLVGVLFTERINGSRRWFALGGSTGSGFQLQPSELAKIGFVLTLAWYLRYRKNLQEFSGLLIPAAIMCVPFGLILIEPDLGTALLFPLVLVAMLVAAGARLRHLAFVGVVAVIAFATYYPVMPAYQRIRISALMPSVQNDPEYIRGPGFQPYWSSVAIGSGGLIGDPEGARHIRQGLLPEAHTDFIFACIGAQWGFVGCVLILVLYLAFFGAAAEIAGSMKDPFGRLVVVGLSSLILFQALINMAMTMKLAPVVGIALPFVSYGGSSLLTNMLAVGLILNVSVRRQSKGWVGD